MFHCFIEYDTNKFNVSYKCLILLEEIPYITARKMDMCKCYSWNNVGLKNQCQVFQSLWVCVCGGGVKAHRKGIRYKVTRGNTAVSWQLCLLLVRCPCVHDIPLIVAKLFPLNQNECLRAFPHRSADQGSLFSETEGHYKYHLQCLLTGLPFCGDLERNILRGRSGSPWIGMEKGSVILYHVYIIHIIIFLESFIFTWQIQNRLSCSPHWSKINHAHLSSGCLLCLACLSKLLLKPSMSVSGELFLFKRQASREPSTHTTTATNRN